MKQASKVLSIKSKTTSVSKGKGASGSSQKKGSSSQSGCANAVMLIKSNEKHKTPIKLVFFETMNIKIAIVGK